MDFNLTQDELAFRDEVRQFLAENFSPDEERGPGFILEWWKMIREKRWIGFSWPAEVIGGGATLMEQFILKDEMFKANAPMLGSDYTGLQWAGPAIIQFGTEEQKAQYIPEILDSKSLWCTGYSEPDVGSDLASLQCKAALEGDEYVINGSKIWTTLAHMAKWIFMMVRTEPDKSVSKYSGITCLLVPMDSEGIEIRPIPSLTGVASFNQVFFNDVRVPVDNRLGKEGQGWMVVVRALANERSGISEATEKVRHLHDLIELARSTRKRGRSAIEDPTVRRALARFQAKISAMRLNGMRNLTKQLNGEAPSTETSVNKLLRGQLEHEMWNFAMGLLGSRALAKGQIQSGSLGYHGTVIGGGTPNIQKNIIGERILGLPKD